MQTPKMKDLTAESAQAAIKSIATKIRQREEADGHSDKEVGQTAKQIVRLEYIKECTWDHMQRGLTIAEAARRACEQWNAIVDEATA